MKTRSRTSSRIWRPAGLTLIEVVASVVLLATVLTGMVIAKSRHTRQLALSQRISTAVRAADELIATWHLSSDGVPVDRTGSIAGDESLHWRTRLVAGHELESWRASVVRVEVMDANHQATDASMEAKPLVSVDIVVPEVRSGRSSGKRTFEQAGGR